MIISSPAHRFARAGLQGVRQNSAYRSVEEGVVKIYYPLFLFVTIEWPQGQGASPNFAIKMRKRFM